MDLIKNGYFYNSIEIRIRFTVCQMKVKKSITIKNIFCIKEFLEKLNFLNKKIKITNRSFFLFFCSFLMFSCTIKKEDINFIEDYNPLSENGNVNVLIEIPAGSNEKWEVDKKHGKLRLETKKDGSYRKVDYLPYPANYGMIPRTLLPKSKGGDGDPLDVIVLGELISRGTVLECKLIGVMKLLDRGEQDDKLIAVSAHSIFYRVNNLEELENTYSGITDILKIWFENYKGKGKMKFLGYEDKKVSQSILLNSIEAYKSLNLKNN